jgi:hypothetical protein
MTTEHNIFKIKSTQILNNKNFNFFFKNNNYYMHVNFYKNGKLRTLLNSKKIEHSVLFLNYLAHFISNSATKRVHGYGTVGLAHNTIRRYKSLHRIVKAYEF